jgi:hypothetical protein
MLETLFVSAFVMTSLIVGAKVLSVNRKAVKNSSNRVQYSSGAFSVVRKSPRLTVMHAKPGITEIISHLSGVSSAAGDPQRALSYRHRCIETWNRCLVENIAEIEDGDRHGAEFYYYELDINDPVCSTYISTGMYVSRAEIHLFPELIPPFHIGCTCKLRKHNCAASGQAVVEKLDFRPFLAEGELPVLPDWREGVVQSSFGLKKPVIRKDVKVVEGDI